MAASIRNCDYCGQPIPVGDGVTVFIKWAIYVVHQFCVGPLRRQLSEASKEERK